MLIGHGGLIGASGGAVNPCAGFLICQNFEGTGYDNAETWVETMVGTGSIDPNYTTGPLRGSQSLRIVSGSYHDKLCTSPAFTGQSEIWGHALFRVVTLDPGNGLLLLDSGDNILGKALLRNASATLSLTAVAEGGSAGYGDATSWGLTGENLHLWWYWKVGSGSNAIMTCWLGNSTTRPASSLASSTNGTVTNNVAKVRFFQFNTSELIVDQVLVKASEFTTVPA